MEALEKREAAGTGKSDSIRRWTIALAGKSPGLFKITQNGTIGLSDTGQHKVSALLQDQLLKVSPERVNTAINRLVATFALVD